MEKKKAIVVDYKADELSAGVTYDKFFKPLEDILEMKRFSMVEEIPDSVLNKPFDIIIMHPHYSMSEEKFLADNSNKQVYLLCSFPTMARENTKMANFPNTYVMKYDDLEKTVRETMWCN